jgi:5-formyltetrahydrofolate cyclo-ligase
MRAVLAGIDPAAAAEKSHAACDAVRSLPEFGQANCVMLYMPMSDELDCTHLALAAWQEGLTVVVPRIDWEHRYMEPVPITSLDGDGIVVGRHGIREPAEAAPWPIESLDLIVIPAMAFDRCGHRLGRGGGFYDRFLSRTNRHASLCGLGYDEQLFDELPRHRHDFPLDLVVTDKQIIRFGPPIGESNGRSIHSQTNH